MTKDERLEILMKYRDVLMDDPCFKAGYNSYPVKSLKDNPYQPFEPFVTYEKAFSAKVGPGRSINEALAAGVITKAEYDHLRYLEQLQDKTPFGRWCNGRAVHWYISGDPIGG